MGGGISPPSSSSSSSPFSQLTSPDKSAVDAIIAEAMDACALDHIAALNTAHLSSSSLLPSHLESRFRKLKSLPSVPLGKENNFTPRKTVTRSDSSPVSHQTLEIGTDLNGNTESKPQIEIERDVDPKSGSDFSPKSENRDPPSPQWAKQGCCFPFSPRKTPKSREKGENLELDLGIKDWGNDNKRMLADIKEQQRKLKKVLKEQEEVRREAAKMVKWVKHASAKMRDNQGDFLSDDGEDEDEDELNSGEFDHQIKKSF